MSRQFSCGVVYAAGLVLLGLAAPVRAAEVDKLLPDDTESVLSVNVRQILDSALVKKHALDKLKEMLKSQEAEEALSDLGFDPLTDVDSLLVATPGGNATDKGLVIVHGRFDLAKFKAKGEAAAKENPDFLKILKDPYGTIYEVNIPDVPQIFYVSFPDKNTVVASPGKEYVQEALAKAAGKKTTKLKSETLPALLARADAKQSFWLILPMSALPSKLPIDNEKIRRSLETIDTVSGGGVVGDDVKVEFLVAVKDIEAAKALAKTINEGVGQAKSLLRIAGGKQLAPLADVLSGVKATAQERTVVVNGQISAEAFDKLLNSNK